MSKDEIIAEIEKFNSDIAAYNYDLNLNVEKLTFIRALDRIYNAWHTENGKAFVEQMKKVYEDATAERVAMHNLIEAECKTRLHWDTREVEVD